MNDLKNIVLAWLSSASSLAAAIESRTLIALISAIVLPVIFFTIGKSVDVALQLYLNRQRPEGQNDDNETEDHIECRRGACGHAGGVRPVEQLQSTAARTRGRGCGTKGPCRGGCGGSAGDRISRISKEERISGIADRRDTGDRREAE